MGPAMRPGVSSLGHLSPSQVSAEPAGRSPKGQSLGWAQSSVPRAREAKGQCGEQVHVELHPAHQRERAVSGHTVMGAGAIQGQGHQSWGCSELQPRPPALCAQLRVSHLRLRVPTGHVHQPRGLGYLL